MDSLLNLDDIDWENIGPSSKSTGCKGRRSDLFTDLRRPLADVDTNRVAVLDGGRAVGPRLGAKESDVVVPDCVVNEIHSETARHRGSRSRSRRQLDTETTSMDGAGGFSVPRENAEACATVQEEGPVARRASPTELGRGRRSLTFETALGQSFELPEWTADDVAVQGTWPGPVAEAAEAAATSPAASAATQAKRFAETFLSVAEEIQQADQTKRRRSSNNSNSARRRSRLLEPPSAWDLDVGDGILDDLVLPDDAPLSLSRPRRSLRLRRKSLVGVTHSFSDIDMAEGHSLGRKRSNAPHTDHPIADDGLIRRGSPDPFTSAANDRVEAAANFDVPGTFLKSSSSHLTSDDRNLLPRASHDMALDECVDRESIGRSLLETAFVDSPDALGANIDCPQLGTIAEEESCCEATERSPRSAGKEDGLPSGPVQCDEASASQADRPRRRAASYHTQAQLQLQPAHKRRRQSKPEPQSEQVLPPASASPSGHEESHAVDDSLVKLYTNKAYSAPAKRPLETIYEQPTVWRGQEKVMSTVRALRSMTFDQSSVSSGKAKVRRQKARQLGWQPLRPDADCTSRLDQRLKDLDEAMRTDAGDRDDTGSCHAALTQDRRQSAEPVARARRRRGLQSEYDQLTAIKSLTLT